MNGELYLGPLKNRDKHGEGFLLIPYDCIYVGLFVENKFDGWGMRSWENGTSEKQIWQNNERTKTTSPS